MEWEETGENSLTWRSARLNDHAAVVNLYSDPDGARYRATVILNLAAQYITISAEAFASPARAKDWVEAWVENATRI